MNAGQDYDKRLRDLKGLGKSLSIQWHPKKLLKFKQQIRRLTNCNWGESPISGCLWHYKQRPMVQFKDTGDRRYRELRLYIRVWINYFGLSEYYRPLVSAPSTPSTINPDTYG
ncbi:MAG: hypothetical protein JMN27_15230 [gamma proteobacterium endosymbiont of Lamellibrachia anaximandri]|nr:hypothetical protein [gamma proteobacterium endosymbiont of Lamellibrachia anaximandri]